MSAVDKSARAEALAGRAALGAEAHGFAVFGCVFDGRYVAAGVFLLALALRLLYLLDIHDQPFFEHLLVDSASYDRWARSLLANNWATEGPFYQDPLYPYLLAALYKVAGRDLALVYIIQCAVAALGTLPLYGLGRRSFGDPRVGLLAALFWAGYKVDFFFDAQVLKTGPGMALVIACLWLFQAVRDRPRFVLAALAGLAASLCLGFRGNFLLVIPAMLAWLGWALYRERGRKALAYPAVTVLFLGLYPTITAVHNYRAAGEFALLTVQSGVNFYVGNQRANVWGVGHDPSWGRRTPVFEDHDFLKEARRRTGDRDLTLTEMDGFWRREALREVAADPGFALARLFRKSLVIVNRHEVPDNINYDFFRERFSVMLKLPLPAFWLAGPLGLAGLVFAARKRKGALPALFLASYTATLLATYVVARYRILLVPPLLLFAAWLLVNGPGLFRSGGAKTRASLAACLIVFAALGWPRLMPPVYDIAWQKLGHAYSSEGAWAKAIEAYQESIRLNPGLGQAWTGLGMAYEATLRPGEALAAYERATIADPRHAGSHYLYGRALARAGERELAMAELEKALEIAPSLAEARELLERMRD